MLAARAAMGDLLGADPRGVIFGRSMTALTFDLARTLAATWRPGDEVIVTRLDHDANIRPWLYAAQAVGATVRWAEFDPRTAELTVADVARELSSRTRARRRDGRVEPAGHPPARRADRGRGARAGRAGVRRRGPPHRARAGRRRRAGCRPLRLLALQVPRSALRRARGRPASCWSRSPREKLAPSPDSVPERFELGTLPYELLAGTTAAVDFLAGLDPDATGTAGSG